MVEEADKSTATSRPSRRLAWTSIVLGASCLAAFGVSAAGLIMSEHSTPGEEVLGDIPAFILVILGIPLVAVCLAGLGVGIAALVVARGHSHPRRYKRLAAGGICLALLSLLLFNRALNAGRQLEIRCIAWSDMHGLGTAMKMYAAKHDEQLPSDMESLVTAKIIVANQLRCLHHWDDASRVCYVYIPGQQTTDNPDNVLLYGQQGCLPNDGAFVLLLNGRVLWVRPYSRVLEMVQTTKQHVASKKAATSRATTPSRRAIT